MQLLCQGSIKTTQECGQGRGSRVLELITLVLVSKDCTPRWTGRDSRAIVTGGEESGSQLAI